MSNVQNVKISESAGGFTFLPKNTMYFLSNITYNIITVFVIVSSFKWWMGCCGGCILLNDLKYKIKDNYWHQHCQHTINYYTSGNKSEAIRLGVHLILLYFYQDHTLDPDYFLFYFAVDVGVDVDGRLFCLQIRLTHVQCVVCNMCSVQCVVCNICTMCNC